MSFDERGQITNNSPENSENNLNNIQPPIQENITQKTDFNNPREQFIQESTHGQIGERAIWRESGTGRFAKSDPENENPNTYLSFTDEQIEKAREEMNTDLNKRSESEEQTIIDPRDKKLQELSDQIAELTKSVKTLVTLLEEQNKTYDNPEDLQKTLDPNKERPLNPLEEVQKTLLEQENARQYKFVKDVEKESIAHDPTYRKTPEVTPVTPQETDPNQERKERNWKRAALIAGVVAGGTTGIVGGVPAAGIGALACIGAGVINKGVDFIGSRRINKLTEQLNITTDPEMKAKLEKRIKNWEKVRIGTKYVEKFLTGAKLGLLGSSIFSGVFMGGHGLIWNQAEIPTGIPTSNSEISGSLRTNTVETTPVDQTVPIEGSLSTPEIPTTDLPDFLPLDQYPDMKLGLEARGMAKGMHDLIIDSKSIWSDAQRRAIEGLLSQGVKLNTRKAGYAIGDLASDLVSGKILEITPDTITQALTEAATKFGQ